MLADSRRKHDVEHQVTTLAFGDDPDSADENAVHELLNDPDFRHAVPDDTWSPTMVPVVEGIADGIARLVERGRWLGGDDERPPKARANYVVREMRDLIKCRGETRVADLGSLYGAERSLWLRISRLARDAYGPEEVRSQNGKAELHAYLDTLTAKSTKMVLSVLRTWGHDVAYRRAPGQHAGTVEVTPVPYIKLRDLWKRERDERASLAGRWSVFWTGREEAEPARAVLTIQAYPGIDPASHVVRAGKYPGRTLADIDATDPGYVVWLAREPRRRNMVPDEEVRRLNRDRTGPRRYVGITNVDTDMARRFLQARRESA